MSLPIAILVLTWCNWNAIPTSFFIPLLIPANAEEDENGEVEIQAYSFTENEDGTEGDLQPIPEDSDAEWDMIEEVFNSFMEE